MMVHKFILSLTILVSVRGVRISPQLDFSESGVQNGYLNSEFKPLNSRDNWNYGKESGIGSEANTKNNSGISTDVLVRIQTNIDFAKDKNDTPSIPDVPIIVGTKHIPISQADRQDQINIVDSIISPQIGTNFKALLDPPPIPTPPNGQNFGPYPGFESRSQIEGNQEFINYASNFPNNINGFDSRNNFHPISIDQVPQLNSYPRNGGSYVHNPVEFKKTYNSVWRPIQWNRNNPNFNYHTNANIPRWTPCLCDNEEPFHPSSTQGYYRSNSHPRISGKLGPLS